MTDEEKLKIIGERYEEVMSFRRELTKETDRGCALMAGSFLEFELQKLIASKLVGTSKVINELFDFNGPLGTFSSRIKMSYSLGLISKETKMDLDIIRKIRNEFGHKYESITFESPSIKSLINNLKQHAYVADSIRTRALFTSSVLGTLGQINGADHLIPKFKEFMHNPVPENYKQKIHELVKSITDELTSKK
ncbi:MltR family transcriptional regulator [Mucilaginibacter ximonensis]|uniref:MltR family transcriptional regulator n=1 Tax=Mucilaginibacter ximonensis TaxID=538021 RepID=A0ABW5Y8K5_9SPHI